MNDPSAVKPDDWDDEEDGDWEAPQVPNPACEDGPGCGVWSRPNKPNPAYKGKWSAPLIDNPAYKGPWTAKQIPNPAFFVDEQPHLLPAMVRAHEPALSAACADVGDEGTRTCVSYSCRSPLCLFG